MDSGPRGTWKTSSTTSLEDVQVSGGEEGRHSKTCHEKGQGQDYHPCIQPLLHAAFNPTVLKVWPGGTPRGPWDPFKGSIRSKHFHNNPKILFAFLLSFSHKCTMGFSRGYLRQPQSPETTVNSSLFQLRISVRADLLYTLEPKQVTTRIKCRSRYENLAVSY